MTNTDNLAADQHIMQRAIIVNKQEKVKHMIQAKSNTAATAKCKRHS